MTTPTRHEAVDAFLAGASPASGARVVARAWTDEDLIQYDVMVALAPQVTRLEPHRIHLLHRHVGAPLRADVGQFGGPLRLDHDAPLAACAAGQAGVVGRVVRSLIARNQRS